MEEAMVSLMKTSASLWKVFVEKAWAMIAQPPSQVSPRSWQFVLQGLWPTFKVIGSALVVLFFLISWAQESLDLKDDFDWKKIGLLMIRIGLINAIYVSVISWIPQFLNGVATFVERISPARHNVDINRILEGLPDSFDTGVIDEIVGAFFGIVCIVAAAVCGAMIVWAIIGRAFKLFILVPIGALPLSTVAGGRGLSRAAIAWIKEFLIAACEVIIIAIALRISAIFLNDNFIANLLGEYAPDGDLGKIAVCALSIICNYALTVGAVKGAETTLRHLFG